MSNRRGDQEDEVQTEGESNLFYRRTRGRSKLETNKEHSEGELSPVNRNLSQIDASTAVTREYALPVSVAANRTPQ